MKQRTPCSLRLVYLVLVRIPDQFEQELEQHLVMTINLNKLDLQKGSKSFEPYANRCRVRVYGNENGDDLL